MTNCDICVFTLIFSFDDNRALKFGGITDMKASPYAADSLSQYSMSSALAAYFSWLLTA